MSKLPKDLAHICPFKLSDTYETLYELQEKLNLNEEYFWNTSRKLNNSSDILSLEKLLQASKIARDNLIIWFHKQYGLYQLNVTISLLTAKIRFIEYKLGLCEAIDLHQSCSIALVDFSNIISGLTDHKQPKGQKKTMHIVSAEINIPIWLSHYRNQICHVPSESPNIAILVELIAKSLNYMNESFWSKLIDRKIFDSQKCIKLVETIASFTKISSLNQKLIVKRNPNFSKKTIKNAKKDLENNTKICTQFRNMVYNNPDLVIDIILNYILQFDPKDKSKNLGLLLEQVILTQGCFEKLIFKLVSHFEMKPEDKIIHNWLIEFIHVISCRKTKILRAYLRRIQINISVKIKRYTFIPAIKCCQIAYRLMQIDRSSVTKMIYCMKPRLSVILGDERSVLLYKMTKIAKRGQSRAKKEEKVVSEQDDNIEVEGDSPSIDDIFV